MQKSARTAAFVATANAEASRTFYEKTLGFRLIAEDPFALVFDANGTRLRIQKGQKGQSHTPVPYTVLGWQVPDIERAIKALVANGAVFERFSFFPQDALGIWTAPDGAKVAWFKDPDGNTLSLDQSPAVSNPPLNVPRVAPYLHYEDVAAILPWLASAFGLEETVRMPGENGKVMHAEMEIGQGLIMLGCPGPDYRNPKRLGQPTQHVCLYVDDVDGHCERARAAGAEIFQEPKDQFYGDRTYGARDPEGHSWYFLQHIREVAPEDMHP